MEKINSQEYHEKLIEELSFVDTLCNKLEIKYFLMFGSLIGAIRHKGFIPWDDDLDIMMPRKDYERFLEYINHNDCSPYTIVNNDNGSAPYLISRLSDSRYHLEFKNINAHELGIFIDVYPMDGAGRYQISSKLYAVYAHFLMLCFCATLENPSQNHTGVLKRITKISFRLIQRIPLFSAKRILDRLCHKITLEKSNYCACMNWLIDYKHEILKKKLFDTIIRVPFEGIQINIPADYDEILISLYGDYMKLPPKKDRIGHHFYEIYKK